MTIRIAQSVGPVAVAGALGCGLFGGKTAGESSGVVVQPPADAAGGAAGAAAGAGGGSAGADATGAGGGDVAAGGATGQAGSGEAGRTAPPSCSGLPGPVMVAVKAPKGTAYCIDTTEVTQAHYAEFLASVKTAPGTEHPDCAAINKDYKPPVSDPPQSNTCMSWWWTPDKTPNHPVVCVDWCDAYAYCEWAGKRLCGKIGGGTAASADYAKADVSQWYNVCSQGGKSAYSYGGSYDGAACEAPAYNDPAQKKDVKAMPGCHGTASQFDAVFDMNGGVAEWEDACSYGNAGGNMTWLCNLRAAGQGPSGLRCDAEGINPRWAFSAAQGFRCCKD